MIFLLLVDKFWLGIRVYVVKDRIVNVSIENLKMFFFIGLYLLVNVMLWITLGYCLIGIFRFVVIG